MTLFIQILDYAHHEVHGGSHYEVSGISLLNSNQESSFGIKTPNDGKQIHYKYAINCSEQTEVYAYVNPTFSGGTAITPLNNNMNSTKTTSIQTLVKDPTITDYGTMIRSNTVGANNSAGAIQSERELILKADTEYLMVIKSKANGNDIGFTGYWYEHTPKNGA